MRVPFLVDKTGRIWRYVNGPYKEAIADAAGAATLSPGEDVPLIFPEGVLYLRYEPEPVAIESEEPLVTTATW